MKNHPSATEFFHHLPCGFTSAVYAALALILFAPGAMAQSLVSNQGFETNGGENSAPAGWTKDFNSYGAFAGAALSGSWGLHAGNSSSSGGSYQDIATVPGSSYLVTVWAQNFASASGTSHLDVLTGVPGTDSFPFPNSAEGSATTQYASGVIDHSFAVGAAWQKFTFTFTATSATTRIGFYNSYNTGDTVHSINVDDISVQNLGISNPGFETNDGFGTTPAGWTKDFNSFGGFEGAARSGIWGLHPGNGGNSGGAYQDIATAPGSVYTLTVWAQNFASASGTSHLDVLTGVPGTDSFPFPNSAEGSTTTQYASGVIDHSFAVGAAWQKFTFTFTATGTTTRIGFYNSYNTGDTVHSINVDDISVVPATASYTSWADGTFVPPLTQQLPDDNQDGDSLNNLQEFAFGTQPTLSTGEIVYASGTLTRPGSPKTVAAAGMYSMVFGRRADYVAAGLTYTVQFSANLNSWVDNNDTTNPPVQVATDGTINVLSVPYPSGSPKPTFSRLKVLLAP